MENVKKKYLLLMHIILSITYSKYLIEAFLNTPSKSVFLYY